MMVDDVYAASAELEAVGIKFQKKPDEGTMASTSFLTHFTSRASNNTVTPVPDRVVSTTLLDTSCGHAYFRRCYVEMGAAGRMKGLAFALDPDGYWVEIVKRMDEEQTRAYLADKEAAAAAKAKEAGSAVDGTDATADAGADDEKEGPDRR